jgi:hypothetical protein
MMICNRESEFGTYLIFTIQMFGNWPSQTKTNYPVCRNFLLVFFHKIFLINILCFVFFTFAPEIPLHN